MPGTKSSARQRGLSESEQFMAQTANFIGGEWVQARNGATDAVLNPATGTVGGLSRSGDGFFFDPSVVVGVDQAAEIMQREVFGPVITVQSVPDETIVVT